MSSPRCRGVVRSQPSVRKTVRGPGEARRERLARCRRADWGRLWSCCGASGKVEAFSPRPHLVIPNPQITSNGGSLGSWVDEDRSKMRVGM